MEPTVFENTPETDLVCFKCNVVLDIRGGSEADSLCAAIDSFRGFACCPAHKDDAVSEARKWLHSKGFVSPFSIPRDVLSEAVETPFSVMRKTGEIDDGWHVTIITTTKGTMTYENFPKRHEDGKWSMCMENETTGMRNYIPSHLTNLVNALDAIWSMETVPEYTEQLEES
jgi:hypothetical protein